ncbi:MAG: alpha/beta hydrolase [Pseudomonadota bacterium]
MIPDLPPLPLPDTITQRHLTLATGLEMHVLEAGDPDAPLMLLLHGFPELGYSWRRVMPALAGAGYRVVAPDLRGYGRTTGWDGRYHGDLASFSMPQLVRDVTALVRALGRAHVDCTVGHDFGSPLTAWAALLRPDVFHRAVLMSAPFGGPPPLAAPDRNPDPGLGALSPPRKHYQWYYSTPEANGEMWGAPQGLHAFLRAYFHMKSADWAPNQPQPLCAWSAGELARLPDYYVMQQAHSMADAVAPAMLDAAAAEACAWLTEADLAVFTAEYARTGFQGGLNWYRCATGPHYGRELSVFDGQPIAVPIAFVAGAADWGYRQVPGALEAMETTASADYRGTTLIPGAGHWVQQEQPEATARAILDFMA